ncbi:MAG: hypothetical protein MHM6MM_006673 [Cercozoa sp. M6MM]
MRRTCAKCGYVHYNNPTPVVAAIVQREEDAKVVLVNSRAWPKHIYALVSGFLEMRESPSKGILREVKEELGVESARLVSLVGAYGFPRMNQVIVVYHVSVRGDITLDKHELRDYRLVETAKLRPWPFGTGLAVADWLAAQAQKSTL